VRPRLVGTVGSCDVVKGLRGNPTSGTIPPQSGWKAARPASPSSISYGRRRVFVCLFDLRDVGDETDSGATSRSSRSHPRVFLFLDPSEYAKVRPWTDANNREVNRRGEMFIPYVEGLPGGSSHPPCRPAVRRLDDGLTRIGRSPPDAHAVPSRTSPGKPSTYGDDISPRRLNLSVVGVRQGLTSRIPTGRGRETREDLGARTS